MSTPNTELTHVDAMASSDRQRYEEALRTANHGEIGHAWRLLQPLMETHPGVYEVQRLRCELARKQGFIEVIVDAHCRPFEALRDRAE